MSQKIKIMNNKINKNNALIKNKKKKVKIIDTNLIEKEMLKGQIHEDPNINNHQNLDEINKNENDNNEIKEEAKKEIIIRPRENYLKDKLKKSFSQLLITTVNKTIDNKIKDIKNEIKSDKILVKSFSKNLKKLIPSKKNSYNTNLTSEENYILRNKYKEIKELKDQEKIMKNKLAKILSNEKFKKENELYNSQRQLNIKQNAPQINISLEQRLKMIENEKIQQQKEELLYKIANTKEKINDLISINIKNEEPKKSKLKNFLINFENDKKIAEMKAKKYFKESKEIKKHMNNDIKLLLEKKKKEFEEEEEKQKNKKDDYLKKFILNIKEKEGKRAKECNQKASLFKSFSFRKPKLKAEECLYNINTEKYLIKEFNYIKEEKNKKKIFMKSISREELEEFSKSYDHYKNEYIKKSEEKQKELFDEWKRRKEQLPNYYGSFLEIADLESKKNEEIEKEKKEKKENLIKNKKDYSLKIKEEKKPVISKRLKKKRLNDIFKRDNPKLAIIKDSLLKRKEKTNKNNILSEMNSNINNDILNNKNKSTTKYNSKSLNNSKQKGNIIKELNKSEIINQKLVHKPTKIKFKNSSVSTEDINIPKKDKSLEPEKKFLSESKIYKDNEDKINKDNNLLSIDTSKKKSINKLEKWNNLINEKRNSLISNIETVKNKAENIDKEFDRNEKILKLSGGIASNPQLGKKISNLILDSIQAKLSILNKINKQI